MTRFGRLLTFLARALEPAERDAVLGDLEELGKGFFSAARDLLGLIARRQAGMWTSWRPWLALSGVSCLAGVQLSRITLSAADAVHKYSAGYYTDLTAFQEAAFILCMVAALLVWSWTGGFVLGSLSGRATWVTCSACLVILCAPFAGSALAVGAIALRGDRHGIPLLLTFMAFMPFYGIVTLSLSLSTLLGSIVGVRRRALGVTQACLIASLAVAFVVVMTWASGAYDSAHLPARWPKAPWPTRLLPFLLASWPAAYMLATARRQPSEEVEPV